MSYRIQLFAAARQRLGCSWVEVHLPPPATAAALRKALAERFPPLADLATQARLAINQQYASEDAVVPPDAEIALIPPVSGG